MSSRVVRRRLLMAVPLVGWLGIGCAPVPIHVSPEVASEIPEGASRVIVSVEGDVEPFPRLVEALAVEGFTVANADAESGTILTEGFEMESSELRLSVTVTDSMVVILPDKRLSSQGMIVMDSFVGGYTNQWRRATWPDHKVQFSKAVAFARDLGLGEVSYRAP